MNPQPLDIVPLWGLFAATCALILLSVEGGYLLGKWRHTRASDEMAAPVGAMVGAILGLLAFMLAFTFSMAASRFEARRQVLLEEANAIGTTYLRAGSCPSRSGLRSQSSCGSTLTSPARRPGSAVTEAVARSEHLQEQLWSQATAAAEKNPSSIMTGLFVQSLNEVIDLHAKRVLVGLRSRIPISIWGGLFALAVVGMASMGYQAGLSATRRSPASLFLVLAFAGVLLLIADLDRPREGLLRVSQEALTDLQRTMRSAQP